jgi:glutamate carboxypeptidase
VTLTAALADGVKEAAQQARPELVEQLLRLTAVDAPSGDHLALRTAAGAFTQVLEGLGCEVRSHTVSGITHLSTRLGPVDGEHVLILCHYDTVWPRGTAAERPGRLVDGRLSGPGTFDMRGGIVAALGALRLLGESGLTRPVQLLLTGDEETGSESSRELILELARGASLVLVTEPPLPKGLLKTARKGWSSYLLEVTGRASHAGLNPHRGVSAIDELLDQLREAAELQSADHGTTVNIGTLAGGSMTNVIAAEASAQLEIRATTVREQERADARMRSLKARRDGATLMLTRRHHRLPMERTPAVAAAARRAGDLAHLLGFELGEGPAAGTSDANLVAPTGVPVIDGLGPEGDGAHALTEHVMIESLVERTALIALLLADDRRWE